MAWYETQLMLLIRRSNRIKSACFQSAVAAAMHERIEKFHPMMEKQNGKNLHKILRSASDGQHSVGYSAWIPSLTALLFNLLTVLYYAVLDCCQTKRTDGPLVNYSHRFDSPSSQKTFPWYFNLVLSDIWSFIRINIIHTDHCDSWLFVF